MLTQHTKQCLHAPLLGGQARDAVQQRTDEKPLPLLLTIDLKEHLADELAVPQPRLAAWHTDERKIQTVAHFHKPLIYLRDNYADIVEHKPHGAHSVIAAYILALRLHVPGNGCKGRYQQIAPVKGVGAEKAVQNLRRPAVFQDVDRFDRIPESASSCHDLSSDHAGQLHYFRHRHVYSPSSA